MNTKLRSMLFAVLLAAAVASASFNPPAARTATAPAYDPLSALPDSDAVMFIDARRIMTEVAPQLLASDPATLAKMMGALNEVRTKTGFNVLAIERIGAGVKFFAPAKPGMKKEDIGVAIIAHGDFDANALINFLKSEGKGKTGEETYGGKIIYSEPRPDPPRVKAERETAAVTVLDPNTIVLGDLPQVRATIDAAAGKGRVSQELVGLATRDTSAVVGLAGNMPPDLAKGMTAGAPPDEMAQGVVKLISNIKQVFGSLGSTPTDFNLIAGFRVGSAEQAASISDMLIGIRQKVVGEIPEQEGRDILNALKITAEGDLLQIRCDVKNEVVQSMVASMMKNEGPKTTSGTAVSKPAAAKTKQTTTKRRRGRRRARH